MAPSSYRFIICHYTTRYPILTQRIVNKSWHSHMKGLQPFVEDFQRAFTADGVAEEDREKVDDLVVPQAPPCRAHALTDGGKDALLTKMLDLAPGPGGQAASHQRLGRPGDGPGRLSAVHPARGVGCSATFFCPSGKTKSDSHLFGGRELDFVLHPPAFSGACSHGSTCGKPVVSLLDKDAGNQKPSAA